MKTYRILKVFVIIAYVFITISSLLISNVSEIYASEYSSDCDLIEDPESRLSCYQDEYQKVEDERKKLEDSYRDEANKYDALYSQILSLNNQIAIMELDITSKQIEISQKNTEINIDEKEKAKNEVEIATTAQEISEVESKVQGNIARVYKMSTIDSIEILFGSGAIWEQFGEAKYVQSIQSEDEDLILLLDDKYRDLSENQEKIDSHIADIEDCRAQIEAEYQQLNELQVQLALQKDQREIVLAESEKVLQQYEAAIAEAQQYENEVSAIVSSMIMELYNSGQLGVGTAVKKGDVIGYEGHSGCALGAHLHFEIHKNNIRQNPLNYLTYNGGYVIDNDNYMSPLNLALLTQGYSGSHQAIDMVSKDPAYANAGQHYQLTEQELRDRCPWSPQYFVNWAYSYLGNPPWSFRMTGEGARVKAIADGTIYKVSTYNGGGKYSIIDHGDGLVSLYLHLR